MFGMGDPHLAADGLRRLPQQGKTFRVLPEFKRARGGTRAGGCGGEEEEEKKKKMRRGEIHGEQQTST
jgi:hypothetical protein